MVLFVQVCQRFIHKLFNFSNVLCGVQNICMCFFFSFARRWHGITYIVCMPSEKDNGKRVEIFRIERIVLCYSCKSLEFEWEERERET